MQARGPAKRLRYAREMAGYKTAAEAARSMDRSQVTYTAHENGGRDYAREDAVAYARQFKVSPAWLVFGDEYAHRDQCDQIPQIRPAVIPGKGPKPLEEMINNPEDKWGIPESYLRQLHVQKKTCVVMEVSGDTMVDPSNPGAAGSLHPGDMAIIDTTDVVPSPPGVFAIDDGLGVIIAAMSPVHGSDHVTYRVSGYNPRFSAFEVTSEKLRVLGRLKAKISKV